MAGLTIQLTIQIGYFVFQLPADVIDRVNLDFESIISFLRDKKASVLQLPERIEFIDTMPLTKAEKVDKNHLKEDIKSKLNI